LVIAVPCALLNIALGNVSSSLSPVTDFYASPQDCGLVCAILREVVAQLPWRKLPAVRFAWMGLNQCCNLLTGIAAHPLLAGLQPDYVRKKLFCLVMDRSCQACLTNYSIVDVMFLSASPVFVQTELFASASPVFVQTKTFYQLEDQLLDRESAEDHPSGRKARGHARVSVVPDTGLALKTRQG
jgi:hypothetical protein